MQISIADCRLQCPVRSARFLICAMTLGLLAASTQASAVSMCVATAAEFQEALNDASDGGMFSGDDVEINLQQGTYLTGPATAGGPFLYHSTAASGQIILSGGWNSQCNGFSNDASLTILDGNGATGVLNIFNASAGVDVETLTIQNGESGNDVGAGLVISTPNDTSGDIYVGFNILENNHSAGNGAALQISAAGSLRQIDLQTNLIEFNSSDSALGAGYISANGVGEVFITGNTVYGNTAAGANEPGGLYCCDNVATDPVVYANIFWQNTKYGLYLSGTAADVEYNDYGTLGGTTTPDHDVANISKDPKFVNAGMGDFRLSGTSSLLGYSPATLDGAPTGTSKDLTGNAFPLSGKRDLGAYSETIFTDGFDGN